MIYSSNSTVTAHLAKSGVNPNSVGPGGLTALHVARTAEQAKVLLDAGADLNARDDRGRTPLFCTATALRFHEFDAFDDVSHEMAVKANHKQDSAIAQLLLNHGADPFAKDYDGCMSMIDAVCEARRNALSFIAQQARPQSDVNGLSEPRRAM